MSTLINTGPTDLIGPFAIVVTSTPKGVTLTNFSVSVGGSVCVPGSGIFGGASEPAGLLFENVAGNLINPIRGGSAIRVFIQFTNPFHFNLGTFFHSSLGFGLQIYQGPFF